MAGWPGGATEVYESWHRLLRETSHADCPPGDCEVEPFTWHPAPVFEADPARICLGCGSEMRDNKCKLECPRCHYFASCNDYL